MSLLSLSKKEKFYFHVNFSLKKEIWCSIFLVYFLWKEIADCFLILSSLSACLEFYEETSYHRKEYFSFFFHLGYSEELSRKVVKWYFVTQEQSKVLKMMPNMYYEVQNLKLTRGAIFKVIFT